MAINIPVITVSMNNQIAAVHKSVIYKYSSIRYQNQITGPEFI